MSRGLGFGVWGLGFWGLGFGARGGFRLRFRNKGFRSLRAVGAFRVFLGV